jgi:hypothetical protein
MTHGGVVQTGIEFVGGRGGRATRSWVGDELMIFGVD